MIQDVILAILQFILLLNMIPLFKRGVVIPWYVSYINASVLAAMTIIMLSLSLNLLALMDIITTCIWVFVGVLRHG